MNVFRRLMSRIESFSDKNLLTAEAYARKIGVSVGEDCHISTKFFSSEPWLITIGNRVRLARNVQLLTHGGLWSIRKMDEKYEKLEYFGKINIKDNVYVGQGAIIMPGVTIEENCIIGAASIVTKSIPKGSVVAGNPAKFISNIEDFIQNIAKYDNGLYGSSVEVKKEKSLLMKDNEFMIKPYLKTK